MRKFSLRVALAIASAAALLSVAAGQAAEPVKPDTYQRSYEIYNYQTTATSGPQRGEELYFYKCWMCHNQYAKTGPLLKGIYSRSLAGAPTTDEALTEKIKSGGPTMPAFRTTLKDADLADLVSYIKSDGCCFDAENPPQGAKKQGLTAENAQ